MRLLIIKGAKIVIKEANSLTENSPEGTTTMLILKELIFLKIKLLHSTITMLFVAMKAESVTSISSEILGISETSVNIKIATSTKNNI